MPEVEYKGVKYPNLKEFCYENGLSYGMIRYRLHQGWSLEDAISKPKQERNTVLYDGKFYKSITELAKDIGISPTTIRSRLKSGYSLEESIVISDIKLEKQSDFFYECKCKHCGLQFLGTLDIAKKHAREHKEDYENMILNYKD